MIIVFPVIPWGFFWQRPQQLLTRLAAKGEVVFYLAQTNNPADIPAGAEPPGVLIDHMQPPATLFHLWCSTPRRFDVHGEKLDAQTEQKLREHLLWLIEASGVKHPVYLVQHPAWLPLVRSLAESRKGILLYDCMDEHSGFADTAAETEEYEQELFSAADAVVVSSAALLKKAQARNRNVVLVRNGAEVEKFADAQPNGKLDHLSSRPIVGYYGSVRHWFNVGLVAALARRRRDCSFVIIGDEQEIDLSVLRAEPNVHIFNPVPYADLPGYLAYFQACLIPFLVTPLTLATNPVKFIEFLSAGKPVVATRLPELEPFASLCYLAETEEQFLTGLEKALREPQEEKNSGKQKERVRAAQENSWDKRAETFSGVLEQLYQQAEKALGQGINRQFSLFLSRIVSESWLRYAHRVGADLGALINERNDLRKEIDRFAEDSERKRAAIETLTAQRDEISCQVDEIAHQRDELKRQHEQTLFAHQEELARVLQHYEGFLPVRWLIRLRDRLRQLKAKLRG